MEGMRRAMKRKNAIRLDIGLRGEQDVFDVLPHGGGSDAGCKHRDFLAGAVPQGHQTFRTGWCPASAAGLRWCGAAKREPVTEPRRVADALVSMGYQRIAFLDLKRIGRGQGPDRYWAGNMCTYAESPLIGGGVSLADQESLLDMGAGGALFDPFGPEVLSKLDG